MKVLFLDMGRKEYDGVIIDLSINKYQKFETVYFNQMMSAVEEVVLLIMRNEINKVYIDDAYHGVFTDCLTEHGIKIPIESLDYSVKLLK